MDDLQHIYRLHNGEKTYQPFSKTEMARRHDGMRAAMQTQNIDVCLFTSYHNICYYSGFLYCYFGRRYGAVLTESDIVTVSAGIDAGQPWRRSFADNVTYGDWHKDNYFQALKPLFKGAKRIGIEYDHVSLDLLGQLQSHFAGVEFVDCSQTAMWLRTLKSEEEKVLIRKGAEICNIGGRALMAAVEAGVGEHEIAIASSNAMVRAIADSFPFVELMDSWTWFQSGINTDGAHNPVTNKRVEAGDILSLNCFPMMFGYYTALERTLFCDYASDSHYDLWQKNCEVHRRGLSLIRAGARCSDIAKELNELYREWDLLQYRSFGYGHSFGVLCHYYGREAGVELREDVDTVLEANMVVSMEPMITIPDGLAGSGGYREHDILIVGEDTVENITNFPFGTDAMIVGKAYGD